MSLWLRLASFEVLFIVLRGYDSGPYSFGLLALTRCCEIFMHSPTDDVCCDICCCPVGWNMLQHQVAMSRCGSFFAPFPQTSVLPVRLVPWSWSGSWWRWYQLTTSHHGWNHQEVVLRSQAGRGINCALATWRRFRRSPKEVWDDLPNGWVMFRTLTNPCQTWVASGNLTWMIASAMNLDFVMKNIPFVWLSEGMGLDFVALKFIRALQFFWYLVLIRTQCGTFIRNSWNYFLIFCEVWLNHQKHPKAQAEQPLLHLWIGGVAPSAKTFHPLPVSRWWFAPRSPVQTLCQIKCENSFVKSKMCHSQHLLDRISDYTSTN